MHLNSCCMCWFLAVWRCSDRLKDRHKLRLYAIQYMRIIIISSLCWLSSPLQHTIWKTGLLLVLHHRISLCFDPECTPPPNFHPFVISLFGDPNPPFLPSSTSPFVSAPPPLLWPIAPSHCSDLCVKLDCYTYPYIPTLSPRALSHFLSPHLLSKP